MSYGRKKSACNPVDDSIEPFVPISARRNSFQMPSLLVGTTSTVLAGNIGEDSMSSPADGHGGLSDSLSER
jgi:hypothetical protein